MVMVPCIVMQPNESCADANSVTGSLLFRYGPETSDSGTTGRARHLR